MTRAHALAAALPFLVACQTVASSARAPGESEGGLYVYLQPLTGAAERISFTVAGATAVRSDGTSVPLDLPARTPSNASWKGQRLLAGGPVPTGAYSAISLRFEKATLSRPDGDASLMVPGDAVRIELPVSVERRRATTVWVTLDGARSVTGGVSFSPAFSAGLPPLPVPGLVAYVSSPASGNVTVLDRRTRNVMSVIFTGGEPRGIALAMIRLQAFIALGSDDVIQVQDLAAGTPLSQIRLRPGDRPGDVALTPDGSLLVVVNEGSSTVSFLDPAAQVEIDRVPTGQQPEFLLLDRAGRRGYVCNRASGSVTVLDVANRAVAGTIQTEAAPVALGLSRAGDRLYVAHAASPYLNVYSTATLAPVNRVLVGMGASALVVDPRTDLIYLGRNGASQIDVLEPNLLLPVGVVPVPDWVSFAVLDETENVLLAAMPARDGVVAVDLTSRKVAGVAAAAGSPFRIAGAGERR